MRSDERSACSFLSFFSTYSCCWLALSTWTCLFLSVVDAIPDFSLVCRRGYRLSSIRRANSAHQRDTAGSLSIECERILSTNLKQVKCKTLESTPQCNGRPEGCTGSQWLAGFHAYAIENSTNSVLLDPVCCSSPNFRVDSLSCATERLNQAKRPFDHRLLSSDLIYRGMQCWHQYNSVNTIVDLAWKIEVCQFQQEPATLTNDGVRVLASSTREDSTDGNEENRSESSHSMMAMLSLVSNGPTTTSEFSANCAHCTCHCGIDVCGNGAEPIRIVHKAVHPQKCSCDCACKYECI